MFDLQYHLFCQKCHLNLREPEGAHNQNKQESSLTNINAHLQGLYRGQLLQAPFISSHVLSFNQK